MDEMFDYDQLDDKEKEVVKKAAETWEAKTRLHHEVDQRVIEGRQRSLSNVCPTGCSWRKTIGRRRMEGWFEDVKTKNKALKALAQRISDRAEVTSHRADHTLSEQRDSFFSAASNSPSKELQESNVQRAEAEADAEVKKEAEKTEKTERLSQHLRFKKAKEEADRAAKKEAEEKAKEEAQHERAKAKEKEQLIQEDAHAKEKDSINHTEEDQDSAEKEPEEEALPGTEKLQIVKSPDELHSQVVKDPLRHSQQKDTGTFDLEKELARRFPILNTKEEYREVRAFMQEHGLHKLKQLLQEKGFVDSSGKLTTGTQPFNVFARVASGAMAQPGMDKEQLSLGSYAEKYVVACNRPDADANWQTSNNASMAKHHRFLTTKDLRWQWFNALIFGFEDLDEAIAELSSMREAAKAYSKSQNWTGPLGASTQESPS
eukprot:gnl/MRDRNA2_/MRDRNA2_59005_c0_seq1.p1 gnl/MRDRNA2_/MRDRNA2_59005_c0~~gnl/MRDRNA2_/MRDRNA2_59005_c0_seq1.p1  ORF type:complete len:431 (+),score=133.61 gnl/MRDRNA2_/MRDRNA2_59005_c0_seq1:76-1368(+)